MGLDHYRISLPIPGKRLDFAPAPI